MDTSGSITEAQRLAARKAVGEEIRARRARLRLSQQALAEQTGMSKQTIFRLEKGERDLDIPQAIALAAVFGTNFGEFTNAIYTAMSKVNN